MVTITDTLDIIKRLLVAPSCPATRKRRFLLRRWTRTMAVAITCTGRLGTGFKISPRAIGSKRSGPALRAEKFQNPPEQPRRALSFASFARSIQHVTAAATDARHRLRAARPTRAVQRA